MAMERLYVDSPFLADLIIDDPSHVRRAQLMQQDPFGVYRITSNNPANHANAFDSTNNPVPSRVTGFSTSEASAADHYGHPDGYSVGDIFASR